MMDNIANKANEKTVEVLGAEALAELDQKTRVQSVTLISYYLNRIFGNCIWVGAIYLFQNLFNSNGGTTKKEGSFLELILDIIQLIAFLALPVQSLYYWGVLKATFQDSRIGEVMNFSRAYKVAITYTLSFSIAVGITAILLILKAYDVVLNNEILEWLWIIVLCSFFLSAVMLLWSFFVAYAHRSGFKGIVEHYGDEELIDIVNEQYSIKKTLF